ncbi:hypothetical protein, partial [Actinomadura rudentiformis]|uniref:hypothetical protein n=1 Tax=Actinomadura rudentiformis TaxID=359158 RepID=UPI001CEF697A
QQAAPQQAAPQQAAPQQAAPQQAAPQQAWPPPEAAERIRTRNEELAAKSGSQAGVSQTGGSQTGTSMRSCLFLHAQALLDAGLTGQMVTEAVSRGRS